MNNEIHRKNEDEIFCPECGKPVKQKAVICPYCGIQLKDLETKKDIAVMHGPETKKYIPVMRVEPEITPKKRWVALLLAFFFGFWAWIYTYKKSYIKFWIVLFITIVLFSIIFLSMCSTACFVALDEAFQENSESTEIEGEIAFMTGATFFWWIYISCIWLWVLIDYATNPRSFYKDYPK